MEEEPERGVVATSTEGSVLSPLSSRKEKDQQQQQEEEKQEPPCVLPDFQLTSPSLICPFLRSFLHRFSELFPLVNDVTFIETRPHGKRPKHLVEALWLKDVLEKCLKEIEEHGSFSSLSQVVSDHEVAAKRVPESIEHMKSLNAEMHSVRQQIQAEDLAHKEAVINWNKTLVQMKQEIKDLKAQNKLTAKYRADMAVAQADCKRRLREEKLNALRDEINRLTNLVEVEKRVNVVCTDFLKKQNLTLMEEAISLATGHENDVLYMDVMLNKLRDQKIEEEKSLSELEPRYMAEMSKIIAEKKEIERQKTMSIDELRKFETQTMAAIRIQRIWRGHMDRAKHTQELKKIAKKRKELRNKSKKEKKEKQGKEDGKKDGGKKKAKKKK
ncbi:hypothetical protein GOP47_0013757 [Adiantum capillus-veneris]|uniref:Dynein regulatory complex protein 9 n=1 Tax=Adiantum capillus-veneris TaxID=13818 RepID=A0A9D4UPU4_ADICA|nr:hypothetical protein GOP47_0013757 [Adiantum capillus-veneris]